MIEAKTPEVKKSRKVQILEALAQMLQASPGARITTAALAKEVGVSEAALYRHFPSKAKMFEGLIEFIEETIFSKVGQIIADSQLSTAQQCEMMLTVLLSFAERNPGITRILTGDALVGETDRLKKRMVQVYQRLETQLKQLLRDAEVTQSLRITLSHAQAANMILALAEGRISQFVRSDFKQKPTDQWADQWQCLEKAVFLD